MLAYAISLMQRLANAALPMNAAPEELLQDILTAAESPQCVDVCSQWRQCMGTLQRLAVCPSSRHNGAKLPRVLKIMTNLRSLDLSSEQLLGRNYHYQEIGENLAACVKPIQLMSALLDLDLSTLVMDGSELARFLAPMTGLQRLRLNSCGLHYHEAVSFFSSLKGHSCLLELAATRNNMRCWGASALASALPFMKNLQVLDLSTNNISSIGMDALAKAMQGLHALRVLRLKDSAICESGVEALGAALRAMPDLTELDLTNAHLTSELIEVLAPAFHGLQLQKLSLSNNVCLCEGAMALAHGIRGMQSLRWIDLSRSMICDTGAGALALVFASMPDLHYINFRLTSFTELCEEEAAEMCKRLANGRQGLEYLFDYREA